MYRKYQTRQHEIDFEWGFQTRRRQPGCQYRTLGLGSRTSPKCPEVVGLSDVLGTHVEFTPLDPYTPEDSSSKREASSLRVPSVVFTTTVRVTYPDKLKDARDCHQLSSIVGNFQYQGNTGECPNVNVNP